MTGRAADPRGDGHSRLTIHLQEPNLARQAANPRCGRGRPIAALVLTPLVRSNVSYRPSGDSVRSELGR